jgi:DnaK suppressor protein
MTTTRDTKRGDAIARRLVARERARIEAALEDLDGAALAEAELVSQQSGDAAESGTAVAASVARIIGDGLRVRLREAHRAEQRLAAGTYGLSVDSGLPIPLARLAANPFAERTVEEQGALDRVTRARSALQRTRQITQEELNP